MKHVQRRGGMARGVSLTDEQQTALRDAWEQSGRYDVAALAAGCSTASARRYLKDVPKPDHAVATVATLKTADEISTAILQVIGPIFAHITDPNVIAQASLKDASTSAGILIDKFLLLTGQATSRTESLGVDPSKLTPEEREMAAKIRRKLAAEAGV